MAQRHPTKTRLFSPITARILALNLLALIILVIGLLYLGEYRRGLILSDVTALETQGDMFAAALGEGASAQQTSQEQTLVFGVAQQMVKRLVQKGTRAQLFALDGSLMADSGQPQALSPPPEPNLLENALRWAQDTSANLFFGKQDYPLYLEPPLHHADFYQEAQQALQGRYSGMVRETVDGNLLISVAVPVTVNQNVLGALLLSKGSDDIDVALFDVRLHIFKVFLFAFGVTSLLSFYLSGSIAKPLRTLARATHVIRQGMNQRDEIPDLTKRNDEIGDLSGAMRQLTSALWQRLDAIESFAADVAHELKNPLTSLRSAVETAQRVDNPTAQKKLMRIIRHDVDRLDRLISDISEASRVDAEISRGGNTALDLHALLQTLIDLDHVHDKNQQVPLTFQDDIKAPLWLQGIEGRLVQVLQNLIDNARSFSPQGGSILLTLQKQQNQALIFVDDQGRGIPEGSLEKIFNRFYTERPESDSFGDHSGLGLAISRQIIEAHGGQITAQNRLNPTTQTLEGARFIITLPLTSTPSTNNK